MNTEIATITADESSAHAGGDAGPVSNGFELFLARLTTRDRSNVQRHLGLCEVESEPDHGNLWKRLAALMSELSPQSVRTSGFRVVQFFVPDGTFHLQSFALEDFGKGQVIIYAADVVAESVEAGLLEGPVANDGETTTYALRRAPGPGVQIESLTATGTSSAPEYFRHMLGWNRKAVRIVVPNRATAEQIEAVEDYCRRAAGRTKSLGSPHMPASASTRKTPPQG